MKKAALVLCIGFILVLLMVVSVFAEGLMEINVWSNTGHTKEMLYRLVDEWNNTVGLEKGIKINFQIFGGDYNNILNLALKADTAPDIFKPNDLLTQYVNAGWVVAIKDMPGGVEFLSRYKENHLKPGEHIVNGEIYRTPYNIRTRKMIYNKELFKKAGIVDENGNATPPVTWAEVVEYARRITEVSAGEAYGYCVPLGYDDYPKSGLRLPFFASIGHSGFDFESGRYRWIDLKPLIDVLLQMKEDGSWFPGFTNLQNDQARAMFAEGKIGMKSSASYDVGVLNDQFPAKIDWGVFEYPVMDPDNRYKEAVYPYGMYSIGKSALESQEKMDKVMEVFDFLNSDELIAELYEESKYIPYDPEITGLAEKEPDKKGWSEFAEIDDVKTIIFPDEPTGFLRIEGDGFNSTARKILTGVIYAEDIEKTLLDLDERYNKALDEAVEEGRVNIEDFRIVNFREKAQY